MYGFSILNLDYTILKNKYFRQYLKQKITYVIITNKDTLLFTINITITTLFLRGKMFIFLKSMHSIIYALLNNILMIAFQILQDLQVFCFRNHFALNEKQNIDF